MNIVLPQEVIVRKRNNHTLFAVEEEEFIWRVIQKLKKAQGFKWYKESYVATMDWAFMGIENLMQSEMYAEWWGNKIPHEKEEDIGVKWISQRFDWILGLTSLSRSSMRPRIDLEYMDEMYLE